MEKKRSHHIHGEDVVQLIFGSLILGVPAAFTEEAWILGQSLHWYHYFAIFIMANTLIALMVFHTGYHKMHIKLFERLYFRRVFLSYVIICLTCTFLLILINQAPWLTEPVLALQRTIIVSLPASISGITADIIR
jgi:uncharacterized membrane protein